VPAEIPELQKSGPHRNKIENALKYIRENYMEDISPRDVARECNITADWLGKLFKQSTGMTVVTYIAQVRLEQAAVLLKESDLNIAEICYKVGYKTPNYFSKAFAKHTGLSPRDYRSGIGSDHE
jgi:two-component system response regulator YesN